MDQAGDDSSGSERRRFDRLDRSFRLRFGLIGDLPMDEPESEGELLDIGGGGVRFATTDEVQPGSQLLIILAIPGWRVEEGEWSPTTRRDDVGVLRVIGVVKWVTLKEPALGLREAGVQFIGQVR